MRLPTTGPALAWAGAVAGAYFIVASLTVHAFGTVNPPLWYANAIAVAALLRLPAAAWPPVLLGVWGADTLAVLLFGSGPAPVVGLIDVLEITLAATIVTRTGGLPAPLFSGMQVLRFGAACMIAPLPASAAGAGLLWWLEGQPFATGWRTWYVASTLGLLLVTPFLLAWTEPGLRANDLPHRGRRTAIAASVLLTTAACLAFLQQQVALLFLTFPMVLLVTWFTRLSGATTAALCLAFTAMVVTLRGEGPMAQIGAANDVVERVQSVQLYLTGVLFSALPLAILFNHLRDLGRARRDFLAAMSHEIRTPITGVLGMLDLLSQEQLAPAQRRYVEGMRSSGRHLLAVINDILDYSRLQSGKLKLEQHDFAVPELLEVVRSLVHPMAVERGLSLVFEPQADLPLVRGDATRLKQVLLNLTGNAVKFTESGTVTVRVTCRTESSLGATRSGQRGGPAADKHPRIALRFEVRDTGIGVAPEQHRGIFGAFEQADRTTARRYGGSGLGLAISQRLVRAMGSEIHLSSAVGVGSLFWFEVLLEPGDPSRVQTMASRSEMPALAPMRLLVAEDVELNRDILQQALTRHGHAVTFAVNGQEAVDAAARGEFDLVLMDVQMPVMDGVEATRAIRKLPAPVGRMPIVGLTANVLGEERERYLKAGMNACLMKPIDWPEFWSVLAQHQPEGRAQRAPAAGRAALLVDLATLRQLEEMASRATAQQWLQTCLQTVHGFCASMGAMKAEELVTEAHRIKGSAGTFGLVRLMHVARDIEAMARQGRDTGALLQEFAEVVAATEEELKRVGWLENSSLSPEGEAPRR